MVYMMEHWQKTWDRLGLSPVEREGADRLVDGYHRRVRDANSPDHKRRAITEYHRILEQLGLAFADGSFYASRQVLARDSQLGPAAEGLIEKLIHELVLEPSLDEYRPFGAQDPDLRERRYRVAVEDLVLERNRKE